MPADVEELVDVEVIVTEVQSDGRRRGRGRPREPVDLESRSTSRAGRPRGAGRPREPVDLEELVDLGLELLEL